MAQEWPRVERNRPEGARITHVPSASSRRRAEPLRAYALWVRHQWRLRPRRSCGCQGDLQGLRGRLTAPGQRCGGVGRDGSESGRRARSPPAYTDPYSGGQRKTGHWLPLPGPRYASPEQSDHFVLVAVPARLGVPDLQDLLPAKTNQTLCLSEQRSTHHAG